MTRKNPPRLVRGGLTGRVYVLMRYTTSPNGNLQAIDKFDVTEDFDNLVTEACEERKTR